MTDYTTCRWEARGRWLHACPTDNRADDVMLGVVGDREVAHEAASAHNARLETPLGERVAAYKSVVALADVSRRYGAAITALSEGVRDAAAIVPEGAGRTALLKALRITGGQVAAVSGALDEATKDLDLEGSDE